MRIAADLYDRLHGHLFPGDRDEHGAVIIAGLRRSKQGLTLIARELILAEEGKDWVPGKRGYRALPATFVARCIRHCRNETLVYLAVHNHGGVGHVAFSDIDLETHRRGFPALLDIVGNDLPVGALVFAEGAVAGDIWLPDRTRLTMTDLVIVGPSRVVLADRPRYEARSVSGRFDRQVRMFGGEGQAVLGSAKVAIIGLGGVGSILAELLGRLGVGHFVLVDDDRVQPTNLPRLVDATDWDAMAWLCADNRPAWMKRVGFRLATRKVDLAARVIRRANPRAQLSLHFSRMEDAAVVEALKHCDYIFLAADSHRARRLFNAIVHQYLVPGVQLGTRIQSDPDTGDLANVHSVVRLVTPSSGCLLCNQAVNRTRLRDESISADMRERQRYTDEPGMVAPSVITLNALSAGQAANDFLFHLTGLAAPDAYQGYVQGRPIERRVRLQQPRRDPACPDCGSGSNSRYGRGDALGLPMID